MVYQESKKINIQTVDMVNRRPYITLMSDTDATKQEPAMTTLTFRNIGHGILICNQVEGLTIVRSPRSKDRDEPWTLKYTDGIGCLVVKRFKTLAEARREAKQ